MHISSAAFIKSSPDVENLPDDRKPQVAFIGRSNVGKSSLINSLLKTKLSKTSSTPGRTRLINLFLINKNFYLIDLPGYGYAKVSKTERERLHELIRSYLGMAENLKLIVLIIDARHGALEPDVQMIKDIRLAGLNLVLVANKVDTLDQRGRAKLQRLKKDLPEIPFFEYSTVTDHGRSELLQEIERTVKQT